MKFTRKYTLIDWLFVLCGGKFFFDWILPTNPSSKNPMWFMFKYGSKIKGDVCTSRILMCYNLTIIHLSFAVLYTIFLNGFFTIENILINIYPIIVQLYIYYRCKTIQNFRTNQNFFTPIKQII